MDLQALTNSVDTPQRLDLLHPGTGEVLKYGDNDEKVMHLLLFGRDSEVYRKKQRRLLDIRLKEQTRFRDGKISAAKLESDAVEQLVATTAGGKVFLNGEEVEVTPDVAKKLYEDRAFSWIKEQAERHIEDRQNFLPE